MSRSLGLIVNCWLLAAFFGAAPSASNAANISGGIDEHGNHYLSVDGPIATGDPARFAAAISEANAGGYRIDAVRLNSPGGQIWEAMAMAVTVRWVENMATVVQRDAKCESACFGVFAAGYRKYVDPASDPTQIGVHSIYAVIKQWGGAPTFWKEREETTIWAVRRLKAIGVPDSITGKIVTTPPDHMTYLTIADLQQMGVEFTSYPPASSSETSASFSRAFDISEPKSGNQQPRPSGLSLPVVDTVYLSPAVVRSDIMLDSGAVIPSGTAVVTTTDLTSNPVAYFDAHADSVCFFPPEQSHPPDEAKRMCNISYHLRGDDVISTAQVRETSLLLIKQGWASPPPQQSSPSPQAPVPQSTQQESALKQDIYFKCAPTMVGKVPDPVTDIFVWLRQSQQGSMIDLDAWHHTAKGNIYKRSEQYIDRIKVAFPLDARWMWKGRLITDHNIYMTGQLTLANGVYTYNELIVHGNRSQDRSNEITNGVCKEVDRIPDFEQSTQVKAKRPFRVVDATDGFLNIRRGPGLNFDVIATMPEGARGLVGRCIPVGGDFLPFCEVEWQGVSGWASSCCLADVDRSPVPTPQPSAQQQSAEPMVLECDLPGAGTPGVPIVYQAWHGQLLIDNSWSIDDYQFSKYVKGSGLITISRITGKITQEEETISRIGTCQLASSRNRRF